MLPDQQETADLVTFTEEILTRQLHFFVGRDFFEQLLLKTEG